MLSRAIARYNLVCGGPLRGQTMMPGIRAGFGDQEGKSNLKKRGHTTNHSHRRLLPTQKHIDQRPKLFSRFVQCYGL